MKSKIIAGGGGSLLLKLINVGLGFAVALILARSMGAEGYGVYSFAYALIAVLAIPAQAGLPQLVVRETASLAVNDEWAEVKGLWRWSTVCVFLFSLVVGSIVLLVLWGLADSGIDEKFTVISIGLLLLPVIALGQLRGAALRGLNKVLLGQLPELIIRPLAFVLGLIFIIMICGEIQMSPVYAMLINFLAAVIAFFLGAWILIKRAPSSLTGRLPPKYNSRYWFKAIFPLALIGSMQTANGYSDILMLGWLRSDEEVGVYRIVVQGATLVVFGLQAINVVVQPYFASLYKKGSLEKLQTLLTRSAQASFIIALPISIFFIAFGDKILHVVFGGSYEQGHVALSILIVGKLSIAGMGLGAFLLNMAGYESDTARITALSALINVLLNILLIPKWGIEGAAIASASSHLFWVLLLRRCLKSRLRMETFPFYIRKFNEH